MGSPETFEAEVEDVIVGGNVRAEGRLRGCIVWQHGQ